MMFSLNGLFLSMTGNQSVKVLLKNEFWIDC